MRGVTLMTTKAVTMEEIEKDNGSFDAVAFSQQALSSSEALAAVFDHTLLKAEATREQVIRLCEEAAEYRFRLRHGESGMGEHGVCGACGQRCSRGHGAWVSSGRIAFRIET